VVADNSRTLVLAGSLGRNLGLGVEAGPEAEPEAGYSTASRRGSLAERAMRYAFLGSGIGDQVAIQLLPSHTTYIWPSDMA